MAINMPLCYEYGRRVTEIKKFLKCTKGGFFFPLSSIVEALVPTFLLHAREVMVSQ